MKSSVLVIGGAGFIGSNAAAYFAQKGWEVIVFDNFSRAGAEKNVEWLAEVAPSIEVVRGDIVTDNELLSELVERVDHVLHLAAQVAVTTSIEDPRMDFENNIVGTFNVLEAIRLSKRRPSLLYASTNKVYGALEHIPLHESDTRHDFHDVRVGVHEGENLDFHSPYGCSKGAAEQYVRDYSRIYGLKTVVFRQSCIYGYRQFGIEDQGWVAWFLIATMLNKPITIYGDGKQVRDILFIDDLVDLYHRAMTNIDTVSGHIFNTGGGRDNALSLHEFFSILQELHGREIPFGYAPERAGDQKIFISDNGKLKQMLGWEPKVGKHEGIKLLKQWVEDHKHYFV